MLIIIQTVVIVLSLLFLLLFAFTIHKICELDEKYKITETELLKYKAKDSTNIAFEDIWAKELENTEKE